MVRPCFLCCFIFAAALVLAQISGDEDSTGEEAVAEQYLNWARGRIESGRPGDIEAAETALERAAGFADVSSDISYLLALTRVQLHRPAGAALAAVHAALEAGRWRRYSEKDALLLEAGLKLRLRSYGEVLAALPRLGESLDSATLRILALRGLGELAELRSAMAGALERYPRSAGPVRLLLTSFHARAAALVQFPLDADRNLVEPALVDLALKRLPALLDEDPELAYMAVPFIRDTEEARRLLGAYRARGKAAPESLPAALNLGLISDETALEELFAASREEKTLSRGLLEEVSALLRQKESRDAFSRNLSAYNGVITEDPDNDGYPEILTRYTDGLPSSFHYDADQDGLAELVIYFKDEVPGYADVVVLREAAPGAPEEPGAFVYPARDEERLKARIRWERYPAVLDTELEERRYIPPPFALYYSPVKLAELFGSPGPLYPERERFTAGITRRVLVNSAAAVERAGRVFEGALERVELLRGIPQRSAETLGGQLVAETEYRLGRPFLERVDLDLDGRLETVRRFRRGESIPAAGVFPAAEDFLEYARVVESVESDWDGDGLYEYAERILPDSRVERSWDMDKDGLRERHETSGPETL